MPDPKKNVAYTLPPIGLFAAGTATLLTSPTLAAGDFKVSTDESALANLASLPTVAPAASGQVLIALSQSEMNGDRITVRCIDQTSPKEWDDVMVSFDTTVVTVDDLVRSATPANSLDVSAAGEVSITQAGADKVFGASGAALSELAQATPTATPSPRAALMLLYMALRNALSVDKTALEKRITNDSGTVIAKKPITSTATVYTEGEMVSGP